jgi:predicted transposase YbfD/YdcC
LWNKTTHEVQFYLSSLPPQNPQIVTAIRQHWGIENGLHWSLDVTFGEDACRVRSLHTPHNLSLLRRFAVNALNRVGGNQSLRQKSKRAAMDDNFMLRVLAAALPDPRENPNPSCQ